MVKKVQVKNQLQLILQNYYLLKKCVKELL